MRPRPLNPDQRFAHLASQLQRMQSQGKLIPAARLIVRFSHHLLPADRHGDAFGGLGRQLAYAAERHLEGTEGRERRDLLAVGLIGYDLSYRYTPSASRAASCYRRGLDLLAVLAGTVARDRGILVRQDYDPLFQPIYAALAR